jgi:hypothetical protein
MTDGPVVLLRDGRRLLFEERFTGPELDPTRWIPHYLPQWSSRAASAARYSVEREGLRLRIDPDQPPWAPEWDGPTRVSNLQTGVRSGPVGSPVGQHRFRPDLVVREEQDRGILFAPSDGVLEVRARASGDDRSLTALWMIGIEDEPEHSAEVCVMEVFGREVGPNRGRVGLGVHPFGDPSAVDDFVKVEIEADLTEWHDYAVDRGRTRIDFFVDERHVHAVHQVIPYPMQLMLDLYQFPPDPATALRPTSALVRSVLGWSARD